LKRWCKRHSAKNGIIIFVTSLAFLSREEQPIWAISVFSYIGKNKEIVMFMKLSAIGIGLALSLSSAEAQHMPAAGLYDVVVPALLGDPSGPARQVGQMYLDISGEGGTGQLKAIGKDGSVMTVSTSQSYSWSGRIDQGGTSWLSAGDASNFGDMASDSYSLVEMTNNGFGTVTAGGDTIAGFTFTPPRTGFVEVTANFSVLRGGLGDGDWRLTDGTTHFGLAHSYSNGEILPASITGVLEITSTSAKTIKLQGKGASTLYLAYGDVYYTIKYID
jgi:hypothetical protein